MSMEALRDRHLECLLELALAEGDDGGEAEVDEALCRRTWEAFSRKRAAKLRKARREQLRMRLRWGARAAACLVLALAVAMPIAVAASPAVRSRVLKLLMEPTPEYTGLSLVEEAAFDVPAGYAGEWYMSWIPEGYVLTNVIPEADIVEYDGARGEHLFFTEMDEHTEANVNTEGARIDTVLVNGREVMIVDLDDELSAVWSTEDRYFLLILEGGERPPERETLLKLVGGVRRIVR